MADTPPIEDPHTSSNVQYNGERCYLWLYEVDVATGQRTGRRKLNIPSDPDYIAPIMNTEACPLPTTTTTTESPSTTTTTSSSTTTTTTVVVPNIRIINIQHDLEMGTATFEVEVTGTPFVGYANGRFMSATSQSRQIVGTINTGVGPLALKILADSAVGAENRKSIAVNIPVGVYYGDMEIGVNTVPIEEGVSADLSLSFALTNVYEDGIPGADITLPFTRFAIEA